MAVTALLALRSATPASSEWFKSQIRKMKNVIALFLLTSFVLFGCASKKEPEVDFKPLQMHWILAEGDDDSQMPLKDNCVILLTGRLMGEPAVQASAAGELNYEIIYGRTPENAETLYFRGFCRDLPLADNPECSWYATCDKDLKIVVKFDNGD